MMRLFPLSSFAGLTGESMDPPVKPAGDEEKEQRTHPIESNSNA